ncbi:hypothetical protein GCM10010277_82660 [Streptomyces longisporoflavus]|uniref:hypothetical protein n=1 Tax=Streptomyces longisporoflavus TaxID=28044 RepID=UPI00167C9EDD|nr:hypothetical protein [Streptomyces longisporoflavus]GGV71069.1 hypothetical protein GCM10010277_82660 [Streptomyces longisporoflavus]
MAEQIPKQHALGSAGLGAKPPFHPRLGDLALDLAHDAQIGVVVDVPSESSASYHLRLPGGGGDWRADSDGTTLRPVAVPVTHVTPMHRDVKYDHQAKQAVLPVTIHHEDGGISESLLILSSSQVELYRVQLEQLSLDREKALGQ